MWFWRKYIESTKLLLNWSSEQSQPSSVTINWHTVNRWCPKGSALGPLLWNIFENDLTYEIKLDFSTYADDHQLHEMGEDLAKVKSSLAGNAEKASRWYEVNLLKGNFSKYKTMLMHNDDKVTTSLSLNIQGMRYSLRTSYLYYACQSTATWTSATILRWRLIWMRSAILGIRVMFLVLDNVRMLVYYASLQRLPLTHALKGFFLWFKPVFWWTPINRYHSFSRALT